MFPTISKPLIAPAQANVALEMVSNWGEASPNPVHDMKWVNMCRKKRKKLHGTVKKVIKLPYSKEKAEIDVHEAEDLCREIRVDNDFMDDTGEKASLKPGAEVDVVIEADTDQIKKPD